MRAGRPTRLAFGAFAALVLLFIYAPLAVVAVNSFNSDRTFGWPPPGFTTKWWSLAADAPGPRAALRTSVEAGLGATAIALVLGSLLALALTRYRFFGRNAISLLVVLPIALPGIVTGIALQSVIQNVLDPVFGVNAGLFTIIVGHATFCIVVVFNNVTARLRRLGGSLEAASSDLGARPLTTFRLVTFPLLRSALLAGALLAFALSFDEIVVTTFTAGPGTPTLPIWIFNNLFRPNQAPVVNVVAVVLVVVSIIPVWLAQRLSGSEAAESRL
ncbi:putative spermidine/putrescine transport system permease protein [Pedococcus dokdonensis]|uniref:Putative spermidine/putrescine transport system permease protein n=1 Tax=Pedococcus dokdonensis TaxID=443156 RepID=A0A1H0TAT1_9MICO|nr:ABC transporter permease [Pedococcus dokdonensis]SDP51114.1 putative spermidine/putrescine transport system permease protein [Pedococcus dokdonensis]